MTMKKNADNIVKRSAALLMVLLLICAIIPAQVFADTVWYLDESGNLFCVEETVSVVQEEQADLLQQAPAEEPAQPEEPFTSITGTAEDSAVFTAYGRFPEGSEMFVTQCDFGGDLMQKVFPAEKAEKISEYKAYNVSFTLNGEPYDPEMTLKFTVLPNMQNPVTALDVAAYSSYISTIAQNKDGIVLSAEQVEELTAAGEGDSIHYVSETFYNLFDIETEQQGENKLVFWSDLYTPIVIYREGFDFDLFPFVLTSGGSVTLSSILASAELDLDLADIAEQGIIYLGDPELVEMNVHESDGDWVITSTQNFSAAQPLKIIFKNGGELSILLCCEGSEPEIPVTETEEESPETWAEMLRDVERTGSWPRDVVTIAQTQLGYAAGEGGYTRYGEWYGDPYGDWCAMFCSFCMAFAGVDSAVVPYEQNCARWIEQLKVKDLYHDAAGGYAPKAGDLIFFSNGAEADHVGIVYDNEPGQIVTIEGNNPEKICTVNHSFYLHDDARILGYGEMPESAAAGTEAGLTGIHEESIPENTVLIDVSTNTVYLPDGQSYIYAE